MKIETMISSRNRMSHPKMLFIAAAAACLCVTSCIAPIGSYGGGPFSYQPGYRVTHLPSGYRSEYISGNTYYYQNGTYYRRDSIGYVVAEAPRDSRYYDEYMTMRQSDYSDRRHDHRRQDHHNYDSRNERGKVISQLPYNHRTVDFRGTTYYQVDDRFYVRTNRGYVSVNRPY